MVPPESTLPSEPDATPPPRSGAAAGLRRAVHVLAALAVWSALWLAWVVAQWWDSTSHLPRYVYGAGIPVVALAVNLIGDRGRVTKIGLTWLLGAVVAGGAAVAALTLLEMPKTP